MNRDELDQLLGRRRSLRAQRVVLCRTVRRNRVTPETIDGYVALMAEEWALVAAMWDAGARTTVSIPSRRSLHSDLDEVPA